MLTGRQGVGTLVGSPFFHRLLLAVAWVGVLGGNVLASEPTDGPLGEESPGVNPTLDVEDVPADRTHPFHRRSLSNGDGWGR